MSNINSNIIKQIQNIERDRNTVLYYWNSNKLLMTAMLSDGYYLLVADCELMAHRMLKHFYDKNSLNWELQESTLTSLHCILDSYPEQDIVGYMLWNDRQRLRIHKFDL